MTPEQLEAWLTEQLASRLKVPPGEIDPVRRLEEYGLDSLEAVSLTGEIEVLLGRPVDPTILWDHPSVRAVALHLTAPRDRTRDTAGTPAGPAAHRGQEV
jgi:acyl carrier protein